MAIHPKAKALGFLATRFVRICRCYLTEFALWIAIGLKKSNKECLFYKNGTCEKDGKKCEVAYYERVTA